MIPASRSPGSGRVAGFTLIETLAAMALMGLIVSALAMITSQWLPNWNRGFDRIQRSESIGIALDRIGADIGAAEFMRANRETKSVLFDGSELSIVLARTSLGPSSTPGLDVIRIAETTDSQGFVLTRSRAAFAPGAEDQLKFGDPVVLLRAPFRVSFSYAGRDGVWKNSWREAQTLPAAVMLTVRDAATDRPLPYSRVAVIHIDASAESVCAQAEGGCDGKTSADAAAKNPRGGDTGK
jgi:general secretion pathway protein J